MSRNGSGVYSLPAGTAAVTSETISSTKFNTLTEDLEADANEVRPIVAGGTGAASASAARTNLGLAPIEPLLTDPAADRITFWDDSESAFGYLTLGTGLSITTTVLSLDADLSTLAGLTVAADNFIAGNAGGTAWEVKTPAQARTSLGLGTAATVNTGTSGGTVPLLNGANTWSARQIVNAADEATDNFRITNTATSRRTHVYAGKVGSQNGDLDLDAEDGGSVNLKTSGSTRLAVGASSMAYNSNTVWHAGNDGAGSGLDADTLDGVEASAFAILSGSNIYLGQQQITSASPAFVLYESDAGTNEKYWRLSSAAGALRIQANNDAVSSFVNAVSLQRSGDTITEIELNATLIDINANADISGDLTAGSITAPPAAGTTTTGSLTAAANANRATQLTGNPTIAGSVFTAGDFLILYAGSAARTITQGAGMTMRLDGTATTGNRTLAARGMAVVYMVSATECVVSGGAVT